ncbi:MAG: hypothetical protein IMY71_08445 [Bacteroidetes bacterium]|nr:hypothetical protein [Bacteroidota bacterium]
MKHFNFFKLFAPIFLLVLVYGFNNPVSETQKDTRIKKIDFLTKAGYEIIDLHAHLKGGLTMEQLLEHSRITGIKYGVAANCGVGFLIQNDSGLSKYYHSVKDYPVYHGMQAEGREWVDVFSPDTIALFDYVFTDALTFYDNKGRRTRLWMKDEVFVENVDSFINYYVNQIVEILNNEPINIYVNPTFLPEIIRERYDELWTEERMMKVIVALTKNDIALEINARFKIPSANFIRLAKTNGVKFTLGTNNGTSDLGYLEYSLQMIEECGLEPNDFWKP